MKKTIRIICTEILFSALAITAARAKGSSNTAQKSTSGTVRELKVLTSAEVGSPQDPNKKLIYQRLEKSIGIKINWTCYVKDQFDDKRNLALSKKSTLPDVILNADMSTLDLLRFARQGVIMPVENLIDTAMPNLKAVLDANPGYRKLITAPDGHIYSFPWIEQLGTGKEAIQAVGGMPFINKAWLDKLGLKMPETTDDLVKVLEAFRDKNPDGKGDVIPMSFIVNGGNEDFGFLLGAFGYGDNPDHIVVTNDGKVVYSCTQEGYRKGIEWMHTLQKKKLIDPEAFTQSYSTLVAKGNNGRYGLFFSWDNYGVGGPYAKEYVPLPTLTGPDGTKNAVRQSGSAAGGFQAGRAVICSTCKDPVLAAKWVDAMYAPLQSIQDNWGTYGQTDVKNNIFDLLPDGTLKHRTITGESNWEARVAQMVGGPLAVLNSYYGKYVTCPPDAVERMNWVKSYVPDMKNDMVYPNVFMNQEDSTSLAQYETAVKQYAEMEKATWILNGGIAADWSAYLKKMDELGLQKYLAIKQKYLNAYLGK